jgi:hypothetical protein
MLSRSPAGSGKTSDRNEGRFTNDYLQGTNKTPSFSFFLFHSLPIVGQSANPASMVGKQGFLKVGKKDLLRVFF